MICTEVAEAGRVLSRLGLVTAYGHVSARAGDSMLITPAADLAGVTAAAVLEVPLSVASGPPGAGDTPGAGDAPGSAGPLPAGVPAEAWIHLALYRARPDVAAIARAQPAPGHAAKGAILVLVQLRQLGAAQDCSGSLGRYRL